MKQYIDKATLVTEIENIKSIEFNGGTPFDDYACMTLDMVKEVLDTLEVKDNFLDKFKTLQHITGNMKSTIEDWGYAPNLYQFDGSWHVDWISCEEGDSIYGFTGETPEEAIDKAYNWFHSTFCNN